jgi:hypothetical protein
VPQRERQEREPSLDDPAQHENAAEPDPDWHDHQMQLQGDCAAEVHRSLYALEAAVATLVPLDTYCCRQDQKVDPEQAPEWRSGRQLGSFVADLAGDSAPACCVQRDASGKESGARTQ